MEKLKDYINREHGGSQVDFAKAQEIPTTKQEVNRWIKHGGFFVVESNLVQVKRKLTAAITG